MSKLENISQRTLMEVLTHEIETIKETTKVSNQVALTLDRKLIELKETKLETYINRSQIDEIDSIFKLFLNRLDNKLPSRISLPNWLLISIFSMFLLLLVSLGYNYIQKEETKSLESTARYYYNKAIELGYNPETDN